MELKSKQVLQHPYWFWRRREDAHIEPLNIFCHNERCWAYGRAGEGHDAILHQKERRYKCKRCKKTFSQTEGTTLYRTHKSHELVVAVVTLLAYGCPIRAIVAAFGLDEHTIAR